MTGLRFAPTAQAKVTQFWQFLTERLAVLTGRKGSTNVPKKNIALYSIRVSTCTYVHKCVCVYNCVINIYTIYILYIYYIYIHIVLQDMCQMRLQKLGWGKHRFVWIGNVSRQMDQNLRPREPQCHFFILPWSSKHPSRNVWKIALL